MQSPQPLFRRGAMLHMLGAADHAAVAAGRFGDHISPAEISPGGAVSILVKRQKLVRGQKQVAYRGF